MTEISRHIAILLLDNDCVIIPGFAGFVAHYIPAELDEASGRFYPPKRTIGFNPQLQLNDSLLAQSYTESYDISYPEAMHRLEMEIDEIKQSIEIYGEYEFEGIGNVSKTSDGHYSFNPCTAGLLTPALYGLKEFIVESATGTSLPLEYIDKTDEGACINQEKHDSTIVDNISESIDKTLDVQAIGTESDNEDDEYEVDDEYDEDESTIFGISIRKLWYAAAAAVICLLLPFAYNSMPIGKGSSNKMIQSSIVDTGQGQKAIETIKELVSDSAKETEDASVTNKETDVTSNK